jgi:hypothetical protein
LVNHGRKRTRHFPGCSAGGTVNQNRAPGSNSPIELSHRMEFVLTPAGFEVAIGHREISI